TLSAFSEVVTNQRSYDRLDLTGLDRSSTGERYRVGVNFGTTGEILRGEIGGGWGIQHAPTGALPDASGFILDANATWRATPLTSFLFTARS
ncbi:outer membrane beta-barrel protein, partial [Acinetobacter baumannii]